MDASRNKAEIRAPAVATAVAAAVATAVAKFAAQLRARLPENATLWVGLSGGRDSVVLLHLARQLLPERVRALHVHHGLSPHADAWAAFCEQLCREWDIPCTLKKVEVPRHDGQGVEAAARHARYQAFRESAAEYLALAHHRRDQAETLLFNLCRGAGVVGAAAMPPQRQIGNPTLLRPLLDVGADAIAAYATAEQLRWVEDESNADPRYSRNFLRHQILPELKTRFPAAETTLARAASHFAEAQELLDDLAAQDDKAIAGQLAPHLPPLLALSPARQANWLRYWLKQQNWHTPETAALREALRQLATLTEKPDRHFTLKLPEGELRLWQNRLYCVPHIAPLTQRAWDGKTPCKWADGWLTLEPCPGAGLSAVLVAGKTFTLRPRQGGEQIVPQANRPHRPLKKLLQENRIPPWQRERLPLIFVDDELVAVPDVAVAAKWQCQTGQAGVQVSYQKTGEIQKS
ncbi:MAG: tRNA lysidine(34) synthetase TilS [Zoogloeaceae bacterium]|jgi:tRNA(Ile)-lysidine synthase|nr:tRNA lysidine(34) synthetase TilS [Zoogloeaceae bacterium]